MHISYFKRADNLKGYLQIVGSDKDAEALGLLGFVTNIKHLDAPSLPTVTISHESTINEMSDKKDIGQYVNKLTGINTDLRGSLDTVKQKAISAVESWKQQEL